MRSSKPHTIPLIELDGDGGTCPRNLYRTIHLRPCHDGRPGMSPCRFLGGGVGEPKRFWKNNAPSPLASELPPACRAGGTADPFRCRSPSVLPTSLPRHALTPTDPPLSFALPSPQRGPHLLPLLRVRAAHRAVHGSRARVWAAGGGGAARLASPSGWTGCTAHPR